MTTERILELEVSLGRTLSEIDRLKSKLLDAGLEVEDTTARVTKFERSLKRIESSTPGSAESLKRLAAAQEYFNKRVADGATSAAVAEAAMARIRRQSEATTQSLGATHQQTKILQSGFLNLFQTIAAGGNPMQALMTQGTQMIGVFGRINIGILAAGSAFAISGVAAASAASSIAAAGDAAKQMEGKLRVAVGSLSSARDTYQQLVSVSKQTGVAVSDSANSFVRFQVAARAIGATRNQTLQLVETIQKFGAVGGASTQEAAAGAQQLGQALASGRLQGDELRSIMENMPVLAEALAKQLGVGIGKLREMGEKGELVASVVFPALLRASKDANDQFSQMPRTIEQASNAAATSWNQAAASLDRWLGLSAKVVEFYQWLERRGDAVNKSVTPNLSQQLSAARDELARIQASNTSPMSGLFGNEEAGRRLQASAQQEISRIERLIELEDKRNALNATRERISANTLKAETEKNIAGKAFEELLGRLNPAEKSRIEYLKQQKTIDDALRTGAIDGTKADQARAIAAREFADATVKGFKDAAAAANPLISALKDIADQLEVLRTPIGLDQEIARAQQASLRKTIDAGGTVDPSRYTPAITSAARLHGLDPALMYGLMMQESAGNYRAVNPSSGARGIYQFMPKTAADLGINPDDPFESIVGAARYMRELIDRFKGDVDKALAAYGGFVTADPTDYIGSVRKKASGYTSALTAGIAGDPSISAGVAAISAADLKSQNDALAARAPILEMLRKAESSATDQTRLRAEATRAAQVYDIALVQSGAEKASQFAKLIASGKPWAEALAGLNEETKRFADQLASTDATKIAEQYEVYAAETDRATAASARLARAAAAEGDAARRAAADINALEEARVKDPTQAALLAQRQQSIEAQTSLRILNQYISTIEQATVANERLAASIELSPQSESRSRAETEARSKALDVAIDGTDRYTAAYQRLLSAEQRATSAANDVAFAKEKRRLSENIALLQKKNDLITEGGISSGDEIDRLEYELQIRRDIVDITDARVASLMKLYDQEASLNRTNDAARDLGEGFENALVGAVKEFRDALENSIDEGGIRLGDAFGSALENLGDGIIGAIFNPIIDQIGKDFAASMSGSSSGIGSISSLFSDVLNTKIFGSSDTKPQQASGTPGDTGQSGGGMTIGGAIGAAGMGYSVGSTISSMAGVKPATGGILSAGAGLVGAVVGGPIGALVGGAIGGLLDTLFGEPASRGEETYRQYASVKNGRLVYNERFDEDNDPESKTVAAVREELRSVLDDVNEFSGRYNIKFQEGFLAAIGTGNFGAQTAAEFERAVVKGGIDKSRLPIIVRDALTNPVIESLDGASTVIQNALDFDSSIRKLTDALTPLKDAFEDGSNRAREFGQSVLDMMTTAEKTFGFDTSVPTTPMVKQYAKGTSGAAKGWAWVGEQGPELVKFNGGETVLTAQQSVKFAGNVTRGYFGGTDSGGGSNPGSSTGDDGGSGGGSSSGSGGSPGGSDGGGMAGNPGSENAAHGTAHSTSEGRDAAYGGSWGGDSGGTDGGYSERDRSKMNALADAVARTESTVSSISQYGDRMSVNFSSGALSSAHYNARGEIESVEKRDGTVEHLGDFASFAGNVARGLSMAAGLSGLPGTGIGSMVAGIGLNAAGVAPGLPSALSGVASALGLGELADSVFGTGVSSALGIDGSKASNSVSQSASNVSLSADQLSSAISDLSTAFGSSSSALDGIRELTETIEVAGGKIPQSVTQVKSALEDQVRAQETISRNADRVKQANDAARDAIEAFVMLGGMDANPFSQYGQDLDRAKGAFSSANAEFIMAMEKVGYTSAEITAKLAEGIANANRRIEEAAFIRKNSVKTRTEDILGVKNGTSISEILTSAGKSTNAQETSGILTNAASKLTGAAENDLNVIMSIYDFFTKSRFNFTEDQVDAFVNGLAQISNEISQQADAMKSLDVRSLSARNMSREAEILSRQIAQQDELKNAINSTVTARIAEVQALEDQQYALTMARSDRDTISGLEARIAIAGNDNQRGEDLQRATAQLQELEAVTSDVVRAKIAEAHAAENASVAENRRTTKRNTMDDLLLRSIKAQVTLGTAASDQYDAQSLLISQSRELADVYDDQIRAQLMSTHALERQAAAVDQASQRLEEIKSSGGDLREWIDQRAVDTSSGVSPEVAFTEAQRQFARDIALARGNDKDALGRVTATADRLLEIGKSFYSSSQQFYTLEKMVVSSIESLRATQQYDNEVLKVPVETIATIKAQIQATVESIDISQATGTAKAYAQDVLSKLHGALTTIATSQASIEASRDAAAVLSEINGAVASIAISKTADDAKIVADAALSRITGTVSEIVTSNATSAAKQDASAALRSIIGNVSSIAISDASYSAKAESTGVLSSIVGNVSDISISSSAAEAKSSANKTLTTISGAVSQITISPASEAAKSAANSALAEIAGRVQSIDVSAASTEAKTLINSKLSEISGNVSSIAISTASDEAKQTAILALRSITGAVSSIGIAQGVDSSAISRINAALTGVSAAVTSITIPATATDAAKSSANSALKTLVAEISRIAVPDASTVQARQSAEIALSGIRAAVATVDTGTASIVAKSAMQTALAGIAASVAQISVSVASDTARREATTALSSISGAVAQIAVSASADDAKARAGAILSGISGTVSQISSSSASDSAKIAATKTLSSIAGVVSSLDVSTSAASAKQSAATVLSNITGSISKIFAADATNQAKDNANTALKNIVGVVANIDASSSTAAAKTQAMNALSTITGNVSSIAISSASEAAKSAATSSLGNISALVASIGTSVASETAKANITNALTSISGAVKSISTTSASDAAKINIINSLDSITGAVSSITAASNVTDTTKDDLTRSLSKIGAVVSSFTIPDTSKDAAVATANSALNNLRGIVASIESSGATASAKSSINSALWALQGNLGQITIPQTTTQIAITAAEQAIAKLTGNVANINTTPATVSAATSITQGLSDINSTAVVNISRSIDDKLSGLLSSILVQTTSTALGIGRIVRSVTPNPPEASQEYVTYRNQGLSSSDAYKAAYTGYRPGDETKEIAYMQAHPEVAVAVASGQIKSALQHWVEIGKSRGWSYANGGVFDGPIEFPMRNGTGTFGEAGPEAIMPLAKSSTGQLGVRVTSNGNERLVAELEAIRRELEASKAAHLKAVADLTREVIMLRIEQKAGLDNTANAADATRRSVDDLHRLQRTRGAA